MECPIAKDKLNKWQDEIKSHRNCINQRWSRKIIKYIVPSGIANNQWFTKWEDLDDESRHVAEYVCNIHNYGVYKIKKTEYVLESLLIEFWNNYDGDIFNIGFYDSSTFERFYKYSHMSFSLISTLFHKMIPNNPISTFNNYNKYLEEYYNKKMTITGYKENMRRKFKLLCRIKKYNDVFYYKELKKLILSTGTWTHLFKMDYLHNIGNYFNNQKDIINYYKDVPLNYNHLKRKYKIPEFTLIKL